MNWSDIFAAIWDKLQFGFDIVLPLVAIGIAFKWIRETRRKYEESQKKQLNASVRSSATAQLQTALDNLARQFIFGIANQLSLPMNRISLGFESVIRQFKNDRKLFHEMTTHLKEVQIKIAKYIEEIHISKYQIYPLLDALGNEAIIQEFRTELAKLIDKFNTTNQSTLGLMHELKGIIEFTKTVDIDKMNEDQSKAFSTLCADLMFDKNYAGWLNILIQDEVENAYWDVNDPACQDIRKKYFRIFMSMAYLEPEKLEGSVFWYATLNFQELQKNCKLFLITLASLNHALLSERDGGWSEMDMKELIEKYKSDQFFAHDNEVR